MSDRIAPLISSYTITPSLQTVYEPPNVPGFVDVTIRNGGSQTVKLVIHGNTVVWKLAPTECVSLNPAGRIQAYVDSGTSADLDVGFGLKVSRGVGSSTDTLSAGEAVLLSEARTAKGWQVEILLQLILLNKYMAEIHGETFTVDHDIDQPLLRL
jgi:hypothetical protein